MVTNGGLDTLIGERANIGGVEEMVDAEIRERTMVGSREPPTLFGVGVD